MSTKNTADKAPSKASETPRSALDIEKKKLDDDAVREAVTADTGSEKRGTSSVLPGPPIPPHVQAQVREESGEQRKPRSSGRRGPAGKSSSATKAKGDTHMIDAHSIKEHMEVLGSDGEHVGTVDHCEGEKTIKLTKNDPAANGEHHYIPLDLVSRIDRHVHLSRPAADVMNSWR